MKTLRVYNPNFLHMNKYVVSYLKLMHKDSKKAIENCSPIDAFLTVWKDPKGKFQIFIPAEGVEGYNFSDLKKISNNVTITKYSVKEDKK
jgi:hypothetical protein